MTNQNLDSITRVKYRREITYLVPIELPRPSLLKRAQIRLLKNKFPLIVVVLYIVLAFGGGVWFSASIPPSKAEPIQNASEASENPPVAGPVLPSDVVLFNSPLSALKNYLVGSANEKQLQERQSKLEKYLQSKNSPLQSESRVIAEQENWKLILSISYAESTLGKKCYYNNCSGIGGSQIRTYKSLKNWVIGFNGLLERKYKDQSLEQMCGVYVQPCNPNWLLANKQILSELDERGIE